MGGALQLLMSKPWYKSKTIVFNIVVAMLLALEPVFNLLQPLLPSNVYAVLSVLLVVGNAALRIISSTTLTKGF
jgi:hypothetical protein